jgi:hypothetical protein
MQNHFSKRASRALLTFAAATTLTFTADVARANTNYVGREDVLSFMDNLHTELGFDLAELERIIGEACATGRTTRATCSVQRRNLVFLPK